MKTFRNTMDNICTIISWGTKLPWSECVIQNAVITYGMILNVNGIAHAVTSMLPASMFNKIYVRYNGVTIRSKIVFKIPEFSLMLLHIGGINVNNKPMEFCYPVKGETYYYICDQNKIHTKFINPTNKSGIPGMSSLFCYKFSKNMVTSDIKCIVGSIVTDGSDCVGMVISSDKTAIVIPYRYIERMLDDYIRFYNSPNDYIGIPTLDIDIDSTNTITTQIKIKDTDGNNRKLVKGTKIQEISGNVLKSGKIYSEQLNTYIDIRNFLFLDNSCDIAITTDTRTITTYGTSGSGYFGPYECDYVSIGSLIITRLTPDIFNRCLSNGYLIKTSDDQRDKIVIIDCIDPEVATKYQLSCSKLNNGSVYHVKCINEIDIKCMDDVRNIKTDAKVSIDVIECGKKRTKQICL